MFNRTGRLSSKTKHLIHCIFLITLVSHNIYKYVIHDWYYEEDEYFLDPWQEYGVVWTYCLYFFRFLVFLVLPQCIFNTIGLIRYNAFKNTVYKEGNCIAGDTDRSQPKICFRVVTRGDYKMLVQNNLQLNYKTCQDAGLTGFSFEVATDKELDLSDTRFRQILIPSDYRTSKGALFKARALQYCLDNPNDLNDNDWIVHLDEETLITQNSVRGIINFALSGKHEFGQGVITYSNGEIHNWFTTLADSFRVAEDFGKIRSQFKMFHRPIFGIKGSYVVTLHKAERDVSFDHGRDGSIAEDCFFSMIAYKKNYTFDFIEGEMLEKSPISFCDFIRQRKRWLQGIWLVVHSSEIPWFNKMFLFLSLYGWVTLPLSTSNLIWAYFYPLPANRFLFLNLVVIFTATVNTYLYIFGVMKSFSLQKIGILRFALYIASATLAIPFNVVVENTAVIWGILSNKHTFYIVKKV